MNAVRFLVAKRVSVVKLACLIGVCVLTSAWGLEAQGAYYTARQYYSSWRKYPQREYYYRVYYYKPTPTYAGYRHHYVVYTPAQPRYFYYYNPYRRVYWGRCPVQNDGKGLYSMLAEADRKPTLEEIPEKAFPQPGALPSLPDSDAKEGVQLDLPPDDLPQTSTLPNVAGKE
jgi:hypothetical protein